MDVNYCHRPARYWMRCRPTNARHPCCAPGYARGMTQLHLRITRSECPASQLGQPGSTHGCELLPSAGSTLDAMPADQRPPPALRARLRPRHDAAPSADHPVRVPREPTDQMELALAHALRDANRLLERQSELL